MCVFVDNARTPYKGMRMCHMLADTQDELDAMADRIGVDRRWAQYPNTPSSHYDICWSKRQLAVKLGAIKVSVREMAEMRHNRRIAWSSIRQSYRNV